jgi:hypothetical protein
MGLDKSKSLDTHYQTHSTSYLKNFQPEKTKFCRNSFEKKKKKDLTNIVMQNKVRIQKYKDLEIIWENKGKILVKSSV